MSKRTCSSSSRSYVQRHTRQPLDVRRHTCEAYSLCCLMPRLTRMMRAALAHNIVASTWYALTRAPCAPCAIVRNPAGSTTPTSHRLHGDLWIPLSKNRGVDSHPSNRQVSPMSGHAPWDSPHGNQHVCMTFGHRVHAHMELRGLFSYP
jgi:hypothetical protein